MIRAAFVVVLTAVALAIPPAGAYVIGPSPTLDDLIAEAGFIGKVTVLESKPVADPWFDGVRGFEPVQTQLRVVATYKGDAGGAEIGFRHYAEAATSNSPNGYEPQTYRLERGRTYVLFAAASEQRAIFRQLRKSHTYQVDQGLVLAASTEPRSGQPIKDVILAELTGLLKSDAAADVKYGLAHLDVLSGGTYAGHPDFDRAQVLAHVKDVLSHPSNDVVVAAVTVMGSNNPYMSTDDAPSRLAAIGEGDAPGFAASDRGRANLGGTLYWKELAVVADRQAPAATRALAIRALGRAQEPRILPLAQRWATDAEPLVRAAAAVLLADFETRVDRGLMTRLTTDAQPAVRIGAAEAIGFGQFEPLIPTLGRMLGDADPGVQSAAAASLLSFAPRASSDVLRAHLDHPEFRALFVNALAREDTGAYLDELAEIVRTKEAPEHFWGGRIPWSVSWDLLFSYVQQQPVAQVRDGQFDGVLDALEYPARGGPAGPSYFSSAEPRDLYALYVQRGMVDRAAKFRALTGQDFGGDLETFFERVDRNPQEFQRWSGR
jgi:HEAT repeat protein